MTGFVTRFVAAAGLALMASTAWAQAPSSPVPIEVEGKVRYVFPQQQEIEMDDGTMLTATSPQQLAQLQPGTAVKILYVDDGRRNEIESIEVVAP